MIKRALLVCIGLAGAPALALAQDENAPPAGLAAEGRQQWEQALRIYRDVLAKDPNRHDLWIRVSDIEARLGRKVAAAEALRAAAEAKGTDVKLWRDTSAAFSEADRPREALAAHERAAALETGRVEDVLLRAQLATWIGDNKLAAQTYEEHYRRTKEPSSLLNLARVLGWQGRTDEASRRFWEYRKLRPDDTDAMLDHARLEGWRGNFAVALEILEEYRKRRGDTVPYRRLRAEMLARGGRWFEANAALAAVPEAERGDLNPPLMRAIAAHETYRVGPVFANLAEARRLQPNEPEVRNLTRSAEARAKSYVEGLFGYASDSDRITTLTYGGVGSLRLDNRLYLEAGSVSDTLRARTGTGLDRLDGGRWASVYRAFAGARAAIADDLWASLRFGTAFTSEGDRQLYYAGAFDYRPLDGLQIRFDADHDYHAVSPRAIDRNIHRYNQEITVSWQFPDLRHHLVVSAGYAVFSDGNRSYVVAVEPRRAILRSQHLNLDLGVSGRWSGFMHDLDNGYYDPNLYEQYLVVLYGYVKLSEDDGISFTIAPGVNKDDRQKTYTFSGYLNAEATFGISRDWQLRIAGGTGISIGVAESTTYHRSYGIGRLLRRF